MGSNRAAVLMVSRAVLVKSMESLVSEANGVSANSRIISAAPW